MSPMIGVVWNGSGAFEDTDYCAAVEAAGGEPYLVPVVADEAAVRLAVARCGALVISGGADISPTVYGQTMVCRCDLDPARDDADRWALEEALDRGLPVLGICRGMQALAAFLGGKLLQDIPQQRPDSLNHRVTEPRAHEVQVLGDSLLGRILQTDTLSLNSRHHQAVSQVPPGFRATAFAPDGIIEAIESLGRPFVLGVQWHPENLAVRQDEESSHHRALFEALVGAAMGRLP